MCWSLCAARVGRARSARASAVAAIRTTLVMFPLQCVVVGRGGVRGRPPSAGGGSALDSQHVWGATSHHVAWCHRRGVWDRSEVGCYLSHCARLPVVVVVSPVILFLGSLRAPAELGFLASAVDGLPSHPQG